MDENGVDDLDDIDWDNAPDDVISEFGLDTEYTELTEEELRAIVIEVISEVDLDNSQDIREGTYDEYLIRKKSEKYNL